MFKNLMNKAGLLACLLVIGIVPAQAALPTGATDAFTTLQTDGLALIDLAWPVVVAVTVGFIILKLFKKASSKV